MPSRRKPSRVRLSLSLFAVAAALILFSTCSAVDDPGEDGARHVILISLDTTRTDFIGCYGNDWVRTPRLDGLAAESVRLARHRTVVPVTLPSHLSLLTGTYPHTHGVTGNGYMVDPANLMLAEILRAEGFHTAGFLGSFALAGRFRFAQGFDHFDENFDIAVGTLGADQEQRDAATVTDAVLDYLEGRDGHERLFLFVHYFDAHAPHFAPPPYDRLYGPGGTVEIPAAMLVDTGRPEADDRLNRMRHAYAGEVSYMDEHVGRLLDGLRQRGILDRALLAVTSDHGENLGDHGGMISHGWSTYQTEMDAVGIIRLPGAAGGGAVVSRVTSNIDILPTILEQLGLPIPPAVEGSPIDLAGGGEPPETSVRFGEAARAPTDAELPASSWPNFSKMACVWEGPLKYQMSLHRRAQALFDLERDPGETRNLLATGDPAWERKARELRDRLRAWGRQADPLPSEFEREQIEDTRRRLKALGYLE
jgi:choline-sulfatase